MAPVSKKKAPQKNQSGKTAFSSQLDSSSESDQISSSSNDDSDSDNEQIPKGRTNEEPKISDTDEPFTLNCLHKWDEKKLEQCCRRYMDEKKDSGPRPGKSSTVDGTDATSLTVWWDDFSRLTSSDSTKTSKGTKERSKDPDSFENWFSKTPADVDEVSWLAGPGPSAITAKSSSETQIEDIQVPSIYDRKPKTKGRRALKRDRKAERDKTLGKKWFEMKAPDVDDNVRNDMELIRMRGVLDPKRFYKHQDRKALPKYFQMGTVVDEGSDFYSSRLTKKQRKQTLVEELMADANIRQYNKKKYAQLQQKMRSKKKFKSKKSSAT